MLRFLVVGTFRCGTAYTSLVLNRMGIACGNGWVATPDGVRRYPEVELLGDATPLAATRARDFDGLVLHQVRHPLKVIGSLLGTAGTRNPLAHGPEGEFLARHFVSNGDPLDDAMRHYVEWNALCERHNGYLRYQVERMDATFLVKVADLLGQAVDAALVARALEGVPTDFNTRYSARSLSWSDLPPGPSRDALTSQAARYGYPVLDEPRHGESTDAVQVTHVLKGTGG
jgi:hypothetical protein